MLQRFTTQDATAWMMHLLKTLQADGPNCKQVLGTQKIMISCMIVISNGVGYIMLQLRRHLPANFNMRPFTIPADHTIVANNLCLGSLHQHRSRIPLSSEQRVDQHAHAQGHHRVQACLRQPLHAGVPQPSQIRGQGNVSSRLFLQPAVETSPLLTIKDMSYPHRHVIKGDSTRATAADCMTPDQYTNMIKTTLEDACKHHSLFFVMCV
jgi:hypothetical protein